MDMRPEDQSSDLEFPAELEGRINEFHEAIKGIETTLSPLLTCSPSEIHEKLVPFDRAQVDLAACFALNSLFWMYLSIIGQNPKDHPVKQELVRIKSYMSRAKQIADKKKAPRVDPNTAKRFIRNALWEPKPDQPCNELHEGQPGLEDGTPVVKRVKTENASEERNVQ